jgi:hypothetical protein
MLHPHDPSAPAGEVIGCQCDYDVVVVPAAVAKAGMPIGTVTQRAEGRYRKVTHDSWERMPDAPAGTSTMEQWDDRKRAYKKSDVPPGSPIYERTKRAVQEFWSDHETYERMRGVIERLDRGEPYAKLDEEFPREVTAISYITRYVAAAPKYRGPAYKGIPAGDDLKPGNVYSMPHLTSFTSDMDTAESYAFEDDDPILVIPKSTKGVDISDMTEMTEAEVVLPRGDYRVSKVEERDGRRFVYLEEVKSAPVVKAWEAEFEVRKDRAPSPKVGERVTRPDGTVWEKTGTYSYKKVSGGGEAPAPAGPPGGAAPAPIPAPIPAPAPTPEPDGPAGRVPIDKIVSPEDLEEARRLHSAAVASGDDSDTDELDDYVDGLISKYGLEDRAPDVFGAVRKRPDPEPEPAKPLDVPKVRALASSMRVPMATALRAHESAGLPVGTHRVWDGVEWVKTADGWERVRYAVEGSFEDRASRAGLDDPELLALYRTYMEAKPFTPEHDAALEALESRYGGSGWSGDLEEAVKAWNAVSGEPKPEDLLRADPDYMRYVESSDDSEARMRLDLKKALGARYGVDPYKVVDMKKADKEREAASAEAPAEDAGTAEAADLSEASITMLRGALERDGLADAISEDLGVDSVSHLTGGELREWMSTRYSLMPVPAETSTPASRRLAEAYAADPSSRLALRPGALMAREDVDPGERSWWTPEFKAKLNKVLRNNAPGAPADELVKADHVLKVFPSEREARRFVSDVDGMVADNPITMRFHIKDVARHWAKEPRTKNLFETGTGHGSTSKSARSEWEHSIMDFSSRSGGKAAHDEMLATERPSYAMIGHKESFLSSAGEGYGQSTLVLKEGVKARCTFTLGNSSGEPGAFVLGGASKLLEKDRASRLGSNKATKARCVDSKYTYLETQVWGGVDISRDVDHIVVSGREWERSSKEDQDHMRAVADRCGVELRYRDGEVLYSPKSGARLETPAADPVKVRAALVVPIGTIKRDMGPDGSRVFKVKTSKFTWALCDEAGRKLGGPPVTAPSKWAVTWHGVKPEEMAPDPAPPLTKPGSKDTYTKGGKVYLRHDSAVPVGGVEVRADGSKYVRTSKFTWRKL